MNKVEFIENLTTEDLIEYNYYIISQKKSMTIRPRILSIIVLLLGVYLIVIETARWYFGAIFVLFGLLLFIFTKMILKNLIKKRVIKDRIDAFPPIKVVVDDEGILFAFEKELEEKTDADQEEETKKIEPFKWQEVAKAVNNGPYIFVSIDATTQLILKKADCDNLAELEAILQEKLTLDVRYFVK